MNSQTFIKILFFNNLHFYIFLLYAPCLPNISQNTSCLPSLLFPSLNDLSLTPYGGKAIRDTGCLTWGVNFGGGNRVRGGIIYVQEPERGDLHPPGVSAMGRISVRSEVSKPKKGWCGPGSPLFLVSSTAKDESTSFIRILCNCIKKWLTSIIFFSCKKLKTWIITPGKVW